MLTVVKMMALKVRALVAIVVVLTLAASYLSSLWPLLLARIYDGISSSQVASLEAAAPLLAAFAGAFCFASLLGEGRRVLSEVAVADFESHARQEGFAAALALSSRFVAGRNSAELSAQIDQGVEGCCQVVKLTCNDLLPALATVVFVGAQVQASAPVEILVLMAAYVAVSAAISVFQISSQNGIRDRINVWHNTLAGRMAESFSNHESLSILAAKAFEARRLLGRILHLASLQKKHHAAMGGFDILKQQARGAFFVAILAVGLVFMAQGRMEGGMVVATAMLFDQLGTPLDMLYRLLDEFASSALKIGRLNEILDAVRPDEPECGAASHASLVPAQVPDGADADPVLEVHGVTAFTPALSAASIAATFDVPARSFVCLSGPNGCGKSSIMKAALRYYPYEGTIRLLGRPLGAFTHEQLARETFYLAQTPFLFEGTVRENLAFGLDDPSDAELRCVLKQALVGGAEFGDGDVLDHEIDERGSNLSGGQRQRIAAARLFLRRPKVLFMDEPTASMDVSSTIALMTNVKAHLASYGGTAVLITHQEEVKALCDFEIELESRRLEKATAPTPRLRERSVA